jgi:hypothetical protein
MATFGREAERLQLGRERTGSFVSTNAQSGLSGYDPIAAISPKCLDNLHVCF